MGQNSHSLGKKKQKHFVIKISSTDYRLLHLIILIKNLAQGKTVTTITLRMVTGAGENSVF